MSDVVARVAEVLKEHSQDGGQHWDRFRHRTYLRCKCGKNVRDDTDHEAHVAAAVVEALGLTEEIADGRLYDGSYKTRWVSPWVGVQPQQGSPE